MANPGGRQHVIPASHIGSFSDSDHKSLRKRDVWVRRDDNEDSFTTLAENVGINKHIYTIHNQGIEDRYVDKTWDYVENNLQNAKRHLTQHTKSHLFDAILWSTVLVPFVAQLFVREIKYSSLLEGRAPWLKDISYFDVNGLKDNSNINRLIDYQINCGLLIDAEWRLLHNRTGLPFILNDVGYATFDSTYFKGPKGYLVPLTKDMIAMIAKRNPESRSIGVFGQQHETTVLLLQTEIKDLNVVESFNRRITFCADKEIYGASEELIDSSWHERNGNKEVPIGPVLIQHKHLRDADLIEVYEEFLGLLNISDEERKGALGGRRIYSHKGPNGEKINAFGFQEL